MSNNNANNKYISASSWNHDHFDWSDRLQDCLKKFGLTGFRPLQKEAVNATLAGNDTMILFPTGAGKSLIYQLPAIVTEGVTFVISPLLSLINDQVLYLNSRNIDAAALTSNTSGEEQKRIIDDLQGVKALKIIYVTPERMGMESFQQTLRIAYSQGHIQRFAIDESHCMSAWGNCFRPNYKTLGVLKDMFPDVPILSLTATATANVKQDIIDTLHLNVETLCLFQSSFNRPNLFYSVLDKEGASVVYLMFTRIKTMNNIGNSGIIYCFSKRDCEEVATQLNQLFAAYIKTNPAQTDVKQDEAFAAHYHAGLETDDKTRIQSLWMSKKIKVIVATIAFGMGINNESVRYVYHHTLPQSIESYYQESGRAGRDGKDSDCAVYYSHTDFFKIKIILSDQTNTNEDRRKRGFGPVTEETIKTNLKMFQTMVDYCRDKVTCRRKMQLAYFDENFDKALCNDTCDNCKRATEAVVGGKEKPIDKYFKRK